MLVYLCHFNGTFKNRLFDTLFRYPVQEYNIDIRCHVMANNVTEDCSKVSLQCRCASPSRQISCAHCYTEMNNFQLNILPHRSYRHHKTVGTYLNRKHSTEHKTTGSRTYNAYLVMKLCRLAARRIYYYT